MGAITDDHKKQIAANLREFGYDVTDEYVGEQIAAVLRGERELNVIGLMAKTMLEKNGLLP